MADNKSALSRRRLIKLGIAGLAVLPLSSLIAIRAKAGDAKVKETDALAQELGYRHDATQVDSKKFPQRAGAEGAEQSCSSCQFFQGSPDAEWAPCVVFSGKQVSAKGWCTSWFKKAS